MCRNSDLLRRILETLNTGAESEPLSLTQFSDCQGVSADSFRKHVDFLVEKKLIEFTERFAREDFYRLTWAGHEFLGYCNDRILWRAAMEAAGHLSFEHFYSILKDLIYWKAQKIAEGLWQKK